MQPAEDTTFYLIDSLRPLEVRNVYNGVQIKIIVLQNELGIEQKNVPEFEDIFDEEDEEKEDENDEDIEEDDGMGDEAEENSDDDMPRKNSKKKRFDPDYLEKRQQKRLWEEKRSVSN